MSDSKAIVLHDNTLPMPDGPLEKRLVELQQDYVRRRIANEAMTRTAQDAVTRQVDLNIYGVNEFSRGAVAIVEIAEQPGRSDFAQEPIEQYARRRIDAMARHTEATIDHAAYQIGQKATATYDVERYNHAPRRRKLTLGERFSGWTDER